MILAKAAVDMANTMGRLAACECAASLSWAPRAMALRVRDLEMDSPTSEPANPVSAMIVKDFCVSCCGRVDGLFPFLFALVFVLVVALIFFTGWPNN